MPSAGSRWPLPAILTACCVGFGALPTAWAAGTVVVAEPALASLHPVFASSQAEQQAASLLFRPLVWAGLDRRIDPAESLAAAIVPSDDNAVFTVVLRPWHWSDGTEITADDVLYDWSVIRALGPAYGNYGTGGIPNLVERLTAPDPHTVVFRLRRSVNPRWFELVGLSQITPLPRQAWAGMDVATQESAESEPGFYRVVDGPFRIRSLDPGRDAVFVANNRYDGHRSALDRLVFDFLPDQDVLEALRAHEIDAAPLPLNLDAEASRLRHFDRFRMPSRGSFYSLVPNERNPAVAFFGDVRVRQAIARAIDQRRIIRIALHGQGVPQYGFIPSTEPDWLPADLRSAAPPLAFDPEAARRLLAADGYRPGRAGIEERHGRRLAFTVLVDADVDSDVASFEIIQQELRQVGIAMRIHLTDFDQIVAREVGPPGGWEAVSIGQGSTAFPDVAPLFGSGGSENSTGFSDPRLDALLATAATDPDPAVVQALDDDVARLQPVIFRPEVVNTYLYRPRLCGFDRLYQLNSNLEAEYLRLADDRHPCRTDDGEGSRLRPLPTLDEGARSP